VVTRHDPQFGVNLGCFGEVGIESKIKANCRLPLSCCLHIGFWRGCVAGNVGEIAFSFFFNAMAQGAPV
jgi:hypothetical protein